MKIVISRFQIKVEIPELRCPIKKSNCMHKARVLYPLYMKSRAIVLCRPSFVYAILLYLTICFVIIDW